MTKRFSILQAKAVSDKELSDPAFRTLAALAIFGDKDGWCYPKLSTLGEMLGKSRQAVSKDIQRLAKLGYVQVTPQFKDGSRIHNLYRLLYDTPVNVQDTPPQSTVDTPSTSEVDTPSTSEVDALTTQLTTHRNENNKLFSSLAEKKYFTTFRRKRWANIEQENFFKQLIDKYGEPELIRAIEWAALKNISDLTRIEAACKTMQKNTKNENRKIIVNREDGSINV